MILATGDNEEQEAKRVAEYINADEYYFNSTPEDKTALVKNIKLLEKLPWLAMVLMMHLLWQQQM